MMIRIIAFTRIATAALLLGLAVPFASWAQPGWPLRVPVERGSTNYPIFSIYWDCDGPGPSDGPKVIVCVWADGRVVWSTNVAHGTGPDFHDGVGGRPYYEGKIDPKRITTLIESLAAKNYFDNRGLEQKGVFIPDGCYWNINVVESGRSLSFGSAVDFTRLTSKEARAYEEPPWSLGDFIKAWRYTVTEIRKLIPETGSKLDLFDFEVRVRDRTNKIAR